MVGTCSAAAVDVIETTPRTIAARIELALVHPSFRALARCFAWLARAVRRSVADRDTHAAVIAVVHPRRTGCSSETDDLGHELAEPDVIVANEHGELLREQAAREGWNRQYRLC